MVSYVIDSKKRMFRATNIHIIHCFKGFLLLKTKMFFYDFC